MRERSGVRANNLTLIAREEFRPLGITVSLVHPGMTATDFGYNSVASDPQRAAAYAGATAPRM